MAQFLALIPRILPAFDLAEKIKSMKGPLPIPPLVNAVRAVSVTVFNRTQYELVYQRGYLYSGRFATAPTNVPAFGQMTFTGAAKEPSVMTGVSGGAEFSIAIPDHAQEIAVGFSNPFIGSFGASVVAGSDATAEAAYDKIDSSTVTAAIRPLLGTDTKGQPVTVSFSLVAEPGERISVTVTQNVRPSAQPVR